MARIGGLGGYWQGRLCLETEPGISLPDWCVMTSGLKIAGIAPEVEIGGSRAGTAIRKGRRRGEEGRYQVLLLYCRIVEFLVSIKFVLHK